MTVCLPVRPAVQSNTEYLRQYLKRLEMFTTSAVCYGMISSLYLVLYIESV